MNANVGSFDRVVRILLGLAMIGFALLAKNSPYSFLGWIGVLPIATAFVSFCPLYTILGVRTNAGSKTNP
jgi:Protein of unknown function (DUF2892)